MNLIEEILSHKIRFLKTSILYSSFVVLGASISVIGPTLLDLRQAVKASALQINTIFPSGSIGYLFGSIAGGIVYDRFDSQLGIASFLTILAICEAVIPWNRSVITLAINNFLLGFGGGGIDSGGNVWLLHMWGKSSAPFMQMLHFSFGVGAFIAPLIAEPFLSPLGKNVTEDGQEIEIIAEDVHLTIWWAYSIISLTTLIVVIALIIMYFYKSTDKAHPSILNHKNNMNLTLRRKILILTIASIIFHSYCGLEIAFGRFMTTFVFYSDLHLNKSIGAYMTSVYWGTFTLCRLLSVFVVGMTGSQIMIWSDIVILLVGNAILLIFGNSSETGLWCGVALMGVGSSSIFPTMFSFIEELMPVTSRIGSLFLVVSCLGEFTIPFIVGYYVEDHPLVLIYVTTVASIVCFVLFAILCFISRLSAKVLR